MIALSLFYGCSSPRDKNPHYVNMNSASLIKKHSQPPFDIKTINDIPQFKDTEKLMAPGFLFSMNHPSDEQIRGKYRVQFDGVLRLPYGVRISVIGLDYPALRKKVMDAYRKFFQRGSEDISFQLLKRDYWVDVRGLVKKSGHYLVKRNEPMEGIISRAGGLRGDLKTDLFIVSLQQQNTNYSVSLNQYFDGNGQGRFSWTGGDTIFINVHSQDSDAEAVPMVSVLGGVIRPGNVLYREDATLFYYLNKTGGVVPNVGYEDAYVIRKIGDRMDRINFNITDMDTIPNIVAGDIIMLNSEKKTLEDRIWDRMVQIGSLITSIGILIIAF